MQKFQKFHQNQHQFKQNLTKLNTSTLDHRLYVHNKYLGPIPIFYSRNEVDTQRNSSQQKMSFTCKINQVFLIPFLIVGHQQYVMEPKISIFPLSPNFANTYLTNFNQKIDTSASQNLLKAIQRKTVAQSFHSMCSPLSCSAHSESITSSSSPSLVISVTNATSIMPRRVSNPTLFAA